MTPRLRRAALLSVLTILVQSGVGCQGTSSMKEPGTQWKIQLKGKTLKGEFLEFPSESFQKPTLLVFWASWCGPCREEVPSLIALHTLESERLFVLGVNLDRNREEAISFVSESSIEYPSIHDPELSIADRLGVSQTPTLLLVDCDRRVSWRGHHLDGDFHRALLAVL